MENLNSGVMGAEGFSLKFHDKTIDLPYTYPQGASSIIVNGRPLSSYSSEDQAHYRAAGMAGFQDVMAALNDGLTALGIVPK